MRIIKFILFSILTVSCRSFSAGGSELISRLDRNLFSIRLILKAEDYSSCFITRIDMDKLYFDLDFSAETPLVRAGMVKKGGVWRELSNPLGSSAASALYHEYPVLIRNYDISGSSLYGLSIGLKEESSINFLFGDSFWAGATLSVKTDFLDLRGFASFTESDGSSSNEWINVYPFVPDLDIVHLGLQTVLSLNNLKLDYLCILSGSNFYRSGFYIRLYTELIFNNMKLKALAGLAAPDFISTSLKFSDDKYLFCLWFEFYLLKYVQVEMQSQYREEQLSVVPGAYVPCSGKSTLEIKIEIRRYLLSAGFDQDFSFDSNGKVDIENSLKIRTGIDGLVSFFTDFVIFFDFDLLTGRQFEAELRGNFKRTDLLLLYRFREERFGKDEKHLLRATIEQEVGSGSVFLKMEIGDEGLSDNLSIGYRAVFN